MPFTEEYQNVCDPAFGSDQLTRFNEPLPSGLGADWRPFIGLAHRNAVNLQTILDRVHRGGGGTVFFPPGRYYIGRRSIVEDPMAVASFSLGETTDAPDILVHPNVVLEFAPGAVLVPLNYAAMGVRPRTRAGREDEAPLVIIEIQGAIDAGLHEIFATTLHPRNDDTLGVRSVERGEPGGDA